MKNNSPIIVSYGSINNIPVLFRQWLGAGQTQAIIWSKEGLVYWRIYVSLGPNELSVFECNSEMRYELNSVHLSFDFANEN